MRKFFIFQTKVITFGNFLQTNKNHTLNYENQSKFEEKKLKLHKPSVKLIKIKSKKVQNIKNYQNKTFKYRKKIHREKSSKICNNSIETLHLESFHMETDSGKNLKK